MNVKTNDFAFLRRLRLIRNVFLFASLDRFLATEVSLSTYLTRSKRYNPPVRTKKRKTATDFPRRTHISSFHQPPKNIIFVCKQQRTSLSLPHRHTPPMITHISSSTEEHHLCLQATTNTIIPATPHPPMITHISSSTEEHHLCLQATTNIIIPAPPYPHR